MAGGGYVAQLEDRATRPGRDTLISSLTRWLFIGLSLTFLAALLFAPLAVVFASALERGVAAYLMSFVDPDAASAIRLTLTVAAVVVPLNTLFGIAAAWALAKFEFRGKSFIITLIDLPIAVSPVVSGLVFVLLFGLQGWFGHWLQDRDISIIFALPGIVLATMFVTLPYVARELIPLMQQLGNDEEEAAITLGAGGWMTFFRVTLPKIRWGLRVWRDPVQRARHGRIRRRVGSIWPHSRPDQYYASARRDPVQRIQLRRGLRCGFAPYFACGGDADREVAHRMANRLQATVTAARC